MAYPYEAFKQKFEFHKKFSDPKIKDFYYSLHIKSPDPSNTNGTTRKICLETGQDLKTLYTLCNVH